MSNITHLNTHHRYHGFSCSVDTPVRVPVHPPDLRRAEELNHALALERELADIARRGQRFVLALMFAAGTVLGLCLSRWLYAH